MASTQLAVLAAALGCAGSGETRQASATARWQDLSIGAVSRAVVGAGVAAVTALIPDGRLSTVVIDLTSGRRLWSRPATTAGRPTGMGVAPPAVVAGPAGRGVVASVEPHSSGATMVGRDIRTGAQRWTHPVGTTLGPAPCGGSLCVSEFTARKDARFAVLDAATGRTSWTMPGVAEVEWADQRRVVVFRMATHPVIEAHDLASGRSLWTFPVEQALGGAVDLSGGWSFGGLDDNLIGYVAPYRAKNGAPLSAFGFFSLGLEDGTQRWVHRRSLRVYPGANPAVALFVRDVDASDRYGGFSQLDPRTGRPVATISAMEISGTNWWPAFPADLSALGLLTPGRHSRAYDLRTGRAIAGHVRAWSFCAMTPSALKISGSPEFSRTSALCPYDLQTGRGIILREPPPGWYTGAVDGWRVWSDERGGLHARHDASGTSPGMLG